MLGDDLAELQALRRGVVLGQQQAEHLARRRTRARTAPRSPSCRCRRRWRPRRRACAPCARRCAGGCVIFSTSASLSKARITSFRMSFTSGVTGGAPDKLFVDATASTACRRTPCCRRNRWRGRFGTSRTGGAPAVRRSSPLSRRRSRRERGLDVVERLAVIEERLAVGRAIRLLDAIQHDRRQQVAHRVAQDRLLVRGPAACTAAAAGWRTR